MNKTQKLVSQRAGLMTDVTMMILWTEHGTCHGYDYSENSLFRFIRNKLHKGLRNGVYSVDEMRGMNSGEYVRLTRPLCEEIANRIAIENWNS